MERLKRSSLFWALLFVTVILPVGLRATKQMYHANIMDDRNSGKGAAVLVALPSGYTYNVRTYALPDFEVGQVWLAPRDESWMIPLCTNGGPTVDDCAYDGTGNLDIEGAVTPMMLMMAGVTGRQFNDALRAGDLKAVVANATVLGSGFFVRIL